MLGGFTAWNRMIASRWTNEGMAIASWPKTLKKLPKKKKSRPAAKTTLAQRRAVAAEKSFSLAPLG